MQTSLFELTSKLLNGRPRQTLG
ncbi:protein of unknown function [Burkholderia multivorans]